MSSEACPVIQPGRLYSNKIAAVCNQSHLLQYTCRGGRIAILSAHLE